MASEDPPESLTGTMGIHFPWKTIQLFCKRSQKTELESLTKKKNQKFKVPVARWITRHLQQLFFWISRRDCRNAVLRANVLNPLGRCLYAAAMHGAGGGQQDAEWANTTSRTPCLPTKCLFSCRRDVCAEVGRWLIKIVIRPFFPWIKWVVCCCRKEAGKQRGRQCTCLQSGPTWRGSGEGGVGSEYWSLCFCSGEPLLELELELLSILFSSKTVQFCRL